MSEQIEGNSYNQRIHVPDLESIIGLTWLGVLGATVTVGTIYGTYKIATKVPEVVGQASQLVIDMSQYLPFVNS
jgi:hypothetical protein